MVKFLGFRRVNTDQYSIDGSLAIFASSLELIKTKVQRGGDEPGRAKCFRCVLEAPRARRWAEIGRDIEGTGITGRRTVLERTPGALDRYFHGSRLLNGRGPRYYESALNRDKILSTNRRTTWRKARRKVRIIRIRSKPIRSIEYREKSKPWRSVSRIDKAKF